LITALLFNIEGISIISAITLFEKNFKLTIRMEQNIMLWTIFVILVVLWLIGFVSSYTMGGFIHILLVIAVVVLIYNLITGRRAV
jgi:hypothetical protein